MLVRFQRYPFQGFSIPRIFDFEREIDGLFADFMGGRREASVFPSMDMTEGDNEYVILAEVPGVRKDDLKLSVQDGTITISGERKQVSLHEKARWVRNEIPSGQFTRTFRFPGEVETDRINAELTDGILRIVLPKTERIKPREIVVK